MTVGLIAAGLFTAAVLVILMKLGSGRVCRNNGFVLIPFTHYTKELEQNVRSCYWDEAFRENGHCREILLVRLGTGDDSAVRELAGGLDNVKVLRLGELEDYIAEKRSGDEIERTGKDKGRGR